MFVSGSERAGAALAAWQGCAACGREHCRAGLVFPLPRQGGLRGGVAHALLCTVKPACLLAAVLCCTGPWLSEYQGGVCQDSSRISRD